MENIRVKSVNIARGLIEEHVELKKTLINCSIPVVTFSYSIIIVINIKNRNGYNKCFCTLATNNKS